jgi:NTP pyrophosphatase (non-canonical NTP hydrolase)
MMTSDNWRWLESTRRLQEESFNVDYDELTGGKLADYLTEHAFALTDELSEAMAETTWKSWSKNRGTINKDAFADEMADLVTFAGNMLVAAGVDDDDFWRRFRAKQERNAARQKHGYDAVKSKCPRCRRELDKPKAVEVSFDGDKPDPYTLCLNCASCDEHLGLVIGDKVMWSAGIDVPGLTRQLLVAGTCTCEIHGIGRPKRHADCLEHPMRRNMQ